MPALFLLFVFGSALVKLAFSVLERFQVWSSQYAARQPHLHPLFATCASVVCESLVVG